MNLPDLNQLGPDPDDFTVPDGALSSINARVAKRSRRKTTLAATLAGVALFAGGFGIANLQQQGPPQETPEVAAASSGQSGRAAVGEAPQFDVVQGQPAPNESLANQPLAKGRLRQDDCATAKAELSDRAVRVLSARRAGPVDFTWPPNLPRRIELGSFQLWDDSADFNERSFQASVDVQSVVTTGSNLIVDGVNESDLLLSDGQIVVAVTDRELLLIDLVGADAPHVTDRHTIRRGDSEAYLADGFIWVITDVSFGNQGANSEVTHIEKVRISDGAKLESQGTVEIRDSVLRSSRSIDGNLHLVFSSGTPEIDLVVAQGEGAMEAAEKANREIIDEIPLSEWLPTATTTINGETSDIDLLDCDQLLLPTSESTLGVTSLLTLGADTSLSDIGSTTLFAESAVVSASAERLHLSSSRRATSEGRVPTEVPGRFTWPQSNAAQVTDLHSFELNGAAGVTYRASGTVDGTVLNEFGVDWFNDVLRVATSLNGSGGLTNSVTTMRDAGNGELEVLGTVTDLGPDETIRGVRFLGDTGYVVTFRLTDPLYVLDLSDASNPTLEGELKITGFSSYLHPLPNGRLIGVGSEASDNGRVTGAKVTLFDVSDPANPTTLNSVVYPNSSFTAAQDHLAFMYLPPTALLDNGLLVLPGDFPDGLGAGAKLFAVSDAGVTEIGELPPSDNGSSVLRTMVVDDEIWALTQEGLSRRSLNNFELVGDLSFDE